MENLFKSKLKIILLLFIVFICLTAMNCNQSSENGDTGFDVHFYFKTLDNGHKGGTFELDGVTKAVPSNGVYIETFQSSGTHTINNVNMNGTKGPWVLIRYNESGENVVWNDTRVQGAMEITVNNGRSVTIIKFPNGYDMNSLANMAENIPLNMGVFVPEKKNATTTDDINTVYENDTGDINSRIEDRITTLENEADNFNRYNVVKSSNTPTRLRINVGGSKFTNSVTLIDGGPGIEDMKNQVINGSELTLGHIQERGEAWTYTDNDELYNKR